MICTKCKQELVQCANFCPNCGKKLTSTKKNRMKSRGNGTGCAYYDPDHRYWVAQIVDGYRRPKDKEKQMIPIKKTKGGFKRREDALAYCVTLRGQNDPQKAYTLQEVYDLWEPWYEPRIASIAGYRAAFKHYAKLADKPIRDITPGDLQECMDECKAGKRTHQQMKVVAGLIWAYAVDHKMVERKITENLYTGKGKSKKRDALTDIEVEKIRKAIASDRYADYIFCLCYLGFRPGEMLEIKKDQVIDHNGRLFIVEGKKTDAGIDRTVPVHQKIEQIIRSRLYVPGTDLVFPQYQFSKASKKKPVPLFLGFKQMSDNYLREMVFKPICEHLGIAEGKVPYAARHTFSNKLKKVDGEDIDKARLIGHSDYTFTQTAYQTTNLDELAALVDQIK